MQIVYFWKENQKPRVNTILMQFQQKTRPYRFHLALERMSELTRESRCAESEYNLLLIGFKRTELLMLLVKVMTMSRKMDCLVIWSIRFDDFYFWVNNEGLANLTWRRVISLTQWGEINAEYIRYILLEISPKSNGRVLEMKGVNASRCFLKSRYLVPGKS